MERLWRGGGACARGEARQGRMEKVQLERKLRREPGEKHRWRMSHVTNVCVEWQAGAWKAPTMDRP